MHLREQFEIRLKMEAGLKTLFLWVSDLSDNTKLFLLHLGLLLIKPSSLTWKLPLLIHASVTASLDFSSKYHSRNPPLPPRQTLQLSLDAY